MSLSCGCKNQGQNPKFIVLTGGPGAGKTAVLELIKKNFCDHIAVLPEAASIVFGGGFWRRPSHPAKQAAQRAIFHVQNELERLVRDEGESAVVLCDRGTLDGLAYWDGEEASFWDQLGTAREKELSKYAVVIHLRTPALEKGYNRRNPIRVESASEAAAIDLKIARAWEGHPKRYFVESAGEFLVKALKAVELIRAEVPECCKHHLIHELGK